MGISKPRTKSDIMQAVSLHLPEALPLFDAMLRKHQQYINQSRLLEARAVGIAVLEALQACEPQAHEERPYIDSNVQGLSTSTYADLS
jgi:hypothetical protein